MRKLLLSMVFIGILAGVGFLIIKKPDFLYFKSSGSTYNTDESAEAVDLSKPLPNPPDVIRGIYATAWSAGSSKKLDELIKFIKENDLNAIVIDIKDYSGFVAYDSKLELVNKYNAKQIKISDLSGVIKKLHSENIYVIARQTVFQDPVLAKTRPDLALKSRATGKTWYDHKKLAWVDAASHEAWDYNISIAKEALSYGFDEVNFDYVRFASDGNLDDIVNPFWDKNKSRREVLREFFSYLRGELSGARISADLFGLSTISTGDLGIGQVIEDAFPYFDYIDPMIYPSHYSAGFGGYKNPAEYPYEVVRDSMDSALLRLYQYSTNPSSTAPQTIVGSYYKLRPWLQDFDIGATYDERMISLQIHGVQDSFNEITSTISTIQSTTTQIETNKLPIFSGWLMWASDNKYTTIY